MSLEVLREFVHMDGHGLFIWAAYGITIMVFGGVTWWTRQTRAAIVRDHKDWLKRTQAQHGEP